MEYKVISINDKRIIECSPGLSRIASEQDALDLVGACGENETNLLLIHASNLTDDFFKERFALRLGGNRDYAKTLVYKRRAEFYDSTAIVPGGFIWHLEVMCWHLPESEWQLDKRHVLIRCKQKGSEKIRKLFVIPALSAVKPGAELKISPETVGENREFIRDLD